MANCYVCCIDSYPTFRFGTHPQGADLGSYEKRQIKEIVKIVRKYLKFQVKIAQGEKKSTL